MKARLFQRNTQSGFTLIEMLIALVIFVIALLAIGLLQLRGIAMTRDANMRTTAIFAARSLGEAIKANYPVNYAWAGGNAAPTVTAACNVTLGRNVSSANDCVCRRAQADIAAAYQNATSLPNPLTTPTLPINGNGGKIEVIPLLTENPGQPTMRLAPGSCDALEGQGYRVIVRWSEGTGAIGIQDQSVEVVVMP